MLRCWEMLAYEFLHNGSTPNRLLTAKYHQISDSWNLLFLATVSMQSKTHLLLYRWEFWEHSNLERFVQAKIARYFERGPMATSEACRTSRQIVCVSRGNSNEECTVCCSGYTFSLLLACFCCDYELRPIKCVYVFWLIDQKWGPGKMIEEWKPCAVPVL